ncbi:MAG: undecaprenyl/decaprenyl-phosphate alpha-N-acetylglucosaminyl 1-phosphate transferase, partial [Planctomycetaceae bacterium]|nr:undecaprenyl/decaprenyl-phosphate alpha-N-acetylglucosaminyl 1-phosphate transferase [Planctomycetaceae bacterium]
MTPVVRRLATRVGLVDNPDGHRKLHPQVTPLGGGVAVLLATSLTIAGVFWWGGVESSAIARQPNFTLGLLAAAWLICLVGLLDDALSLRGRQKLAAQFVAVLLIVLGGLRIEHVELFGWHLNLGLLAIPVTVAWLLGAINALNLIDGIDGLAGTVGVILSVTVAGLSMLTGHVADAAVAWALAGGITGFLIFNLPPARIYMGDAGSMTIGLVLGALAIRSSLKGPTTVAMAAPTAIWSVLMFDVLMAVLRRKLTGQSVYATDRAHLHHVLQRRGYGNLTVVLLIGLMCALCAAGALASVAANNELVAVGTSATVLAALVVSGYFGRSECGLLLRRGGRLAS